MDNQQLRIYYYCGIEHIILNGSVYMSNHEDQIGDISTKSFCYNLRKLNIRRVKIERLNDNIFKLTPNKGGTKLYLCKNNNTKFVIRDQNILIGKTYKPIRYLIDPLNFGLTFEDFGFISNKSIASKNRKSPDVWIKGYIVNKPKGMSLGLAATHKMKGKYVFVDTRNNEKIILHRAKEPSLLISRGRLIRKISHRSHNDLIIDVSSIMTKCSMSRQVLVGLFYDEWEGILNIRDIFLYKSEADLASSLFDKNMTLCSTHSIGFDIGIMDKKGNNLSVIEITETKPKSDNHSKGGHRGSMIMARIQTMRIWSIKNNKPSFVVIHNDWLKFGHSWISNFQKDCKKDKCFIYFTDFKENWSDSMADKIVEKMTLF